MCQTGALGGRDSLCREYRCVTSGVGFGVEMQDEACVMVWGDRRESGGCGGAAHAARAP